MKLKAILIAVLCGASALLSKPVSGADNSRTMRGWFVDENCTRERVAAGQIQPSNPDCAKRCVKEGSRLMFLSETEKALFELKDPASQIQNIGYYVELTGNTDDKRVLTVGEVKKLAEVNAVCKRPKLKRKN